MLSHTFQNTLEMVIEFNNVPELDGMMLDDIEIMGVSAVTAVYVDGAQHDDFVFDTENEVLIIVNAAVSMTQAQSEVMW